MDTDGQVERDEPSRDRAAAFSGRAEELGRLRAALAGARQRKPVVALVEGEAGIGKTVLVDRLLASSDAGRVLRASGAEAESLVGFGVADQLLRLAGDAHGGVLTGDAATPELDDVAVGLDLLRLLAEAPDARGTTVVLDDMQWADAASVRALSFAVRRLARAAVLVVLIARDGDGLLVGDDLRRLAGVSVELGPMSVDELRSLAAPAGVTLPELALRRLHEHVRGNPLHAAALMRELPRHTWDDVTRPLPAPRRFAAATARQLAQLSPQARELVRAAAVLGPRSPLIAVASLAESRAPLDALDELVSAGLVRAVDRPTAVIFAHPLVRTVVADTLGLGQRTRLHLAAAELAGDAGAALRHRAAASTGVGADLAAELEAHAHTEAGRGAWRSAAELLVDASRLSPESTARERRRLAAVDAMLSADGAIAADAFRGEVLAQPSGPHRDSVLAHMAATAHDPIETRRLLMRAWRRRGEAGERLSATIAQRLALLSLAQLRADETIEWARRLARLSRQGDTPAASPLALGLVLAGRPAEAEQVLAGVLEDETAGSTLPLRAVRGWLRLVEGDIGVALADLASAAERSRDPASLTWLAAAQHAAGMWDDAAIQLDRAFSCAHGHATAGAHATAIRLALDRGEARTADEHGRRLSALAPASEAARLLAAEAEARIAAARRRTQAVLAALDMFAALPADHAANEPGVFGWVELYATALVRVGRIDEADAVLAPHEARAAERERPAVSAMLARSRARLEAARARGAAAETAFELALEHGRRVRMPYELALTQLAYGQFLRRNAHRRAAADQLERARERFLELGAVPALERCERELLASGLEPAKRRGRDFSRLTPQESAVAELAASGLTNRQIASELIVSVRTVGVHLTRIYAKLGIRSRSELPERPAAHPGSRSAGP